MFISQRVPHTELPISDGAGGILRRCKPAIKCHHCKVSWIFLETLQRFTLPPCSRTRERSSRPRCFVQAGPSNTAPSSHPTTKPALGRCVAWLFTPKDWMPKTNHDHPFVGYHHNRCLQLSSYNSKSVEVRCHFQFVQSICLMILCKCLRGVVFDMVQSKL